MYVRFAENKPPPRVRSSLKLMKFKAAFIFNSTVAPAE